MRESGSGGRGASQNTHPVSDLAPVTYSRRQGDHKWSTSSDGLDWPHYVSSDRRGFLGFGSLGFPVDQFLQLLARLEVGHLLRRHIHFVARLRVAALARLALAETETAEPAQLDLLAAVQGLDDAPEYRVDDDFRVFLGEIRHARHFLDEFRLGHAAARSIQRWLLVRVWGRGQGAGKTRRVPSPQPQSPYRFLK